MRILHLPESTGQQAYQLSRGERELGHDSQVLYKQGNWLNYPSDIQLGLDGKSRALQLLKLTKTFLQIRNKYDIYHFNQGSSLLHFPGKNMFHLELPYYPKDKKLFVTYQGCDARQKYPTMKRQKFAACHNKDCYNGQCNSGRLDTLRQKSIEKMSQYVDHIWAVNPDLLHFLPKEKSSFLPYAVHSPHALPTEVGENKKLKIVHAPTNRAAKGSDIIINIIEKLITKYPNKIEFVCVEKIPHNEALKIYKTADLIIDQILIGWYGAFAVENMLIGKPVIARIEKDSLHFLPPGMKEDLTSSIIDANPENLEDVLTLLLNDRSLLKEKAMRGLSYAKKWHDPKYIAKITTEKYEQ